VAGVKCSGLLQIRGSEEFAAELEDKLIEGRKLLRANKATTPEGQRTSSRLREAQAEWQHIRGHPRRATVTLRRIPKSYFLVGLDDSSANLTSDFTRSSTSRRLLKECNDHREGVLRVLAEAEP
jgi:hypothetical protein